MTKPSTSIPLWLRLWLMSICEKTHMQLPLVGLADVSAVNQSLPKSSEPLVETESSIEESKRRDYQKEWTKRNPEKRAAIRHRYYEAHKESHKAYSKSYSEKNRTRLNIAAKENYKKKRQQIRARKRSEYLRKPELYRGLAKRSWHKHRDKNVEKSRRRRASNPEYYKEASRKYYRENPEKCLRTSRAWQAAHPEHINKYQLDRYHNNPQVNVAVRARTGLRRALRRGGLKKTCGTLELLGCSWADFVVHIERQFLPGMSWDNKHLWQIDHVKALSKWDLTDPVQLAAACNFRNLAPLWAEDNARKGNRDWPAKPSSCPPASSGAQSPHEILA